jgi:peptidoglycan/xylan/chitin deacetylase (PgdA/CDA1 family)
VGPVKKVLVTTSWDDGHTLDLKLARLLRHYKLAATFYVAPQNRELKPNERLSEKNIKELSKNFEIGAHTLTHPELTKLDDAKAKKEIIQSKKILEGITDQKVTSFCYPKGKFHKSHQEILKRTGFKFARTVTRFATEIKEPLAATTTTHTYRHWSDMLQIARVADFHPQKFLKLLLNWDQLAITIFDQTRKTGGTFHLWGHSWEIEENGDWARLENVFRHISKKPSVGYVTNGELA